MILSPRRWNIAWRVRLGLLFVPCLLAFLAWYQFRVTADTVQQYRDIVANTDALLVNTTQMMQNAEAMENHTRGLHLWLQSSASGTAPSSTPGGAADAEKAFVMPYREAKIAFEKAYQAAAAQITPDSPLEKRLNEFYDAGLEWQREAAEPLIGSLRGPKSPDASLAWRPFDDAETTFAATRDELMLFRRNALSGADRFRWYSTLSVLAMEAAALIMALWIGVSLSRAVTEPLEAMVAHSRRIETGDYAAVPIVSNDEFGEVTGAMNAMASSIAARTEELRAAHDALSVSGAQLREKNRELEEFVYTVSHDLKAPLISIQGYLNALHQDFGDELPPDSKHYLARVGTNAKQLESLIGDLIELSRIGRVREQWELSDTRQLAREAAAELTLQAQAKAVQIEIAHDLPAVLCEKKRVRQVFTNLLDNAIKYSDPAKPSRTVQVTCEETPTHWQFCVRDNGIGLETDGLEKAFGIFQRVGNPTAPGSGIGLSIVQRAAQAHAGRSWAASSGAGQGTSFYFTLSKKPDLPKPDLLENEAL